jgi:hypothetical protein
MRPDCHLPSLRANGSRERAPDDRLRESNPFRSDCARLDCFVAYAPLRKRFAFVAGNDGGALNPTTPDRSALRTVRNDNN